MRGRKKIFHANGKDNKAGIAILISDQVDFKRKSITKDKEGYYTMIKGSIQEETITFNIYAPNTGASKYIKQIVTDTKRKMYNNIYNNSLGL